MEHSPTYSYNAKRNAVIFFCFLNIIIYIIFAANSKTIVGLAIKNQNYPEMKPAVIDITKFAVAAASFIGILFELIGLIGALCENVRMTTFYAVLKILFAIITCINVLSASIFYLASAIWSVLTTVVVILFLRELKENKTV